MSHPKRLSQATIAKATGVSRATVSLILRGGTGSSQKTTAKVLAAAKKMGYRPNALVQSIRSGKSRTVGVLVPPHDSYWKDVCYGIHDQLLNADHLPLFLWDSERDGQSGEEHALKQIHRLLDRWVDGVILWPEFFNHYARHLQELERRNIPLVVIDHHIPGLMADTVESDELQIASIAITHLASLGHKNYLIISGPENLGWADKRSKALSKELATLPESTSHELRIPCNNDEVQKIIKILQEKPAITAIIACSDELAHKAYQAAHQLDWKIPDRISIMGVGNINFSNTMTPPLTTIHQHGYAVGKKAAQAELERSSGIVIGPPKNYTVPVELIKRTSTAAPHN